MSTEAIITGGYNHPDVEVKLAILKSRHGYTEARAASLYGKTATLAVIRNGELQVAEGTLQAGLSGRANFLPKGCRNVSEKWEVASIIGHECGYKHTAALAAGALGLFDRITVEEVRAYLTTRELEAREDESRWTMASIGRILRDAQAAQDERQAADARILSSIGTRAQALGLAA